jgi:hypothetical protein
MVAGILKFCTEGGIPQREGVFVDTVYKIRMVWSNFGPYEE